LKNRSRRRQEQPVSGHTQPRWEQSGGVTVKVNTRTDKDHTLEHKLASVCALL